MISDQEVCLGFLRDTDVDQHRNNPLVGMYDGRPAAQWVFGDGGPPHAGIWGTTGGGKSSLLRYILRGLVRRPGKRAITLIDGEGAGEFTMFRRMPGVAQIVNVNPAADRLLPEGEPTSVERAAQALADHQQLATERNTIREQAAAEWEAYLVDPAHHQPPKWYTPPAEVFLVIDGWASFSYAVNRYLPRSKRLDPVEEAEMTGRNGRKNDVHLILADQVSFAKRAKDDTGLPSPLKKQIGLRVAAVGHLGITATEAGMVFDQFDAGASIPQVPGGCLMKVGATMLPFVVPKWINAADPNANLTPEERRASFRALPAPVEGAA